MAGLRAGRICRRTDHWYAKRVVAGGDAACGCPVEDVQETSDGENGKGFIRPRQGDDSYPPHKRKNEFGSPVGVL